MKTLKISAQGGQGMTASEVEEMAKHVLARKGEVQLNLNGTVQSDGISPGLAGIINYFNQGTITWNGITPTEFEKADIDKFITNPNERSMAILNDIDLVMSTSGALDYMLGEDVLMGLPKLSSVATDKERTWYYRKQGSSAGVYPSESACNISYTSLFATICGGASGFNKGMTAFYNNKNYATSIGKAGSTFLVGSSQYNAHQFMRVVICNKVPNKFTWKRGTSSNCGTIQYVFINGQKVSLNTEFTEVEKSLFKVGHILVINVNGGPTWYDADALDFGFE